jgi:hypothetical protein
MMSIGNLRVHRYTHDGWVDLSDAEAVVKALNWCIAIEQRTWFSELFVDAIVYLYQHGVRDLDGFAIDFDTYERDNISFPCVHYGSLCIEPCYDRDIYFVLVHAYEYEKEYDPVDFGWLLDYLPDSFLASIEWEGERIEGILLDDPEVLPGNLLFDPTRESLYGIVLPALVDKLQHLYLKLKDKAR